MRIYLACTVRGDRHGVLAGRVVYDRLRMHGHDVLTGHLLNDDVDAQESALTEREIFERDLRWLAACDAIVAEASGSSYGVGFEVGYVLGRAHETGQRAFLLYDQAKAGRISRLIVGNSHPSCTTVAYDSLAGLSAFIDRTFSPGQTTAGIRNEAHQSASKTFKA